MAEGVRRSASAAAGFNAAEAAARAAREAAARAAREAAARAAREAAAQAAAQAKGRVDGFEASAGAKVKPELLGAGTGLSGTSLAATVGAQAQAAANPQSAGFFDQLQDAARRNIPGYETAESTVKGAIDYVKDLREATDLGPERLSKMTPGDKININAGVNGGFKLGRGAVKGQFEVSYDKNDEGKLVYKLSMDGEVLGGVGKKLLKGKAGAQALAGGGGKMEFEFENPADVQKAMDIMGRMNQAGSTMMISADAGKSNVTPAERDWLNSKLSAVEIRGTGAVDAAIAANVKLPGGINELSAGGKVRVDHALRLEFKEGKPPEAVFKSTVQTELQAGAGRDLGPKANVTDPTGYMLEVGGAKVTVGGQGKVNGKVELETRVPLPADTDVSKLLDDPVGTLKEGAKTIGDNHETKLTLSVDGQGTLNGNGVGINAQISMKGNTRELTGLVMDHALKGDFQGMLKSAGDTVETEVKVEPYTQKGVTFNPGVNFSVIAELGWEFEATSRDVGDRLVEKTTAGELARRTQKALNAA